MKKLSLETLVRHLNGEDVDVTGIKEEIEAELSKGKAKADANRAVYAELHDKVLEVLRVAANPVHHLHPCVIPPMNHPSDGRVVLPLWGLDVKHLNCIQN